MVAAVATGMALAMATTHSAAEIPENQTQAAKYDYPALFCAVTEQADTIEIIEPAEELLDPNESENIQKALIEIGYLRGDIPMDLDDQASLRAACEESGVPFELALAVVWKETTFRNVNGDNGDSIGYMQVQPRWHKDRMERLGVDLDELSVPIHNFRVGCDFLAELLEKYPLAEALTAYNSGKPGHSAYADSVIAYMEELKEGA